MNIPEAASRLNSVAKVTMLYSSARLLGRTKGFKTMLLWVFVRDVCCVGSSSAFEICRECGWSPYAELQDDSYDIKPQLKGTEACLK